MAPSILFLLQNFWTAGARLSAGLQCAINVMHPVVKRRVWTVKSQDHSANTAKPKVVPDFPTPMAIVADVAGSRPPFVIHLAP